MSRTPRIIGPIDQRQNPIVRAMGLPIALNQRVLSSATDFAVLYDFSAEKYLTRVFQGLSVENPSPASRIELYAVDNLMDTPRLFLDIGPQQFFTVDWLQFGPGVTDDSEDDRVNYILARLDLAQGTRASGTIVYTGVQPNDEETVNINGLIYEFSSDQSKNTTSDFMVVIGVDAEASWTNFTNKLNLTQRFVTASIDTATDTVTLTANIGGAEGDAITMADVDTGAVFSGATLSGSSGGVGGYYHVW
jgi:hypothetical protein